MTRFWVGGYGPDGGGAAVGIGLLSGDEGREPTTLAYRGVATVAASPSWLAAHPRLDVVYAALEGEGSVAAFVRSGDAVLAPLGAPITVGQGVCHLAVAPDGGSLVASCYGDGRVVRLGLAADGALRPAVADRAAALRAALLGADQAPAADGGPRAAAEHGDPRGAAGSPEASDARPAPDPLAAADPYASDPDRTDPNGDPRASHAHAAAFLPDGRIATTDLGYDLVRLWRSGRTGLVLDHEVVLPRGTGPRHMVAHPSGHLHVVTEYSCEVFTLAEGARRRWGVVAATIATPLAQIGSDFPAELARSRDGATLYTALRGSDTVAALRVRGDGATVEPFALAEAGVDWPRHHLVYDGALLVAGQRSDDVAVIDLDDRTGAPGRIRHRAPAPSPTVLLAIR